MNIAARYLPHRILFHIFYTNENISFISFIVPSAVIYAICHSQFPVPSNCNSHLDPQLWTIPPPHVMSKVYLLTFKKVTTY